jgi:hypothetical protein
MATSVRIVVHLIGSSHTGPSEAARQRGEVDGHIDRDDDREQRQAEVQQQVPRAEAGVVLGGEKSMGRGAQCPLR